MYALYNKRKFIHSFFLTLFRFWKPLRNFALVVHFHICVAWDAVVWGEVSCTLYLKYSIFAAILRVLTSNWVCKNAFDQYEWCCGHHSCLPSWEARVEALVGPVLKVLTKTRRKGCLHIDIRKWLAFRVFSDKDVKIVGIPRIPSIGQQSVG